MLELVGEGYDVVCGSRYMAGGRQIGGPVLKGFLSRAAGMSLHWLAGVPTHDVTNSFKMYRTAFLQSVTFESTGGFEIGMEAVVKAYVRGGRIAEVPAPGRTASPANRDSACGGGCRSTCAGTSMRSAAASGDLPREPELEALYARRFDERDRAWKDQVWEILWSRVFSRWVDDQGTLLDLGAGYCEFINHAVARRRIAST